MRKALPLLGLALLLTGCGADKPLTQTPPHASALASRPTAVATDTAPAAAADPLTASASDSITATSDPLIRDAVETAGDPLAGDDPLTGPKLPLQHSQSLSGQDQDANDGILLMNGQKMPTQHTHWLRGRVRDARVRILLNGIQLGEFSDLVNRDITPRLRVGINTVTFTYQPLSTQSSAKLELLEGERHPPLPPLAMFQNEPFSNSISPNAVMLPQTRMITFTAR